LFAKLKEGNPGYDLIIPTNDYVERMLTTEMLLPIEDGERLWVSWIPGDTLVTNSQTLSAVQVSVACSCRCSS
jgi:hypothetical protein